MKLFTSISLSIIFFISTFPVESFGQSKKETARWINTYGAEYLSSLMVVERYELDISLNEVGILSITKEEAEYNIIEDKLSVKQFYKIDLSKLDPKETSLGKMFSSSLEERMGLIIKCQLNLECINKTNYYEYKGSESSMWGRQDFIFIQKYEEQKAKRLEKALTHAIKLFGGKSISSDEELFDGN